MKYFFGTLSVFVFSVSIAFANNVFVTEIERPYEVVPLEVDMQYRQTHLGELNDFPIMYEFSVDSTSTFQTFIDQKFTESTPTPFALIMVRDNGEDKGVSEVLRFNPKPDNWHRVKDSRYGMSFLRTDSVSEAIEPGTYRVEVSTPQNQGSYALTIGELQRSVNYFEKLSDARNVQKHFDYSILRMLTSSLVYYPLGIILLVLLLHKTWKYRKLISDDS